MTISIVLYGRNDTYGYNLHKRAALSLNCMAEVLTDSSDEILFVDYNTPDDFPTFPEAIQDTLTARARDILRILRVRPSIHQRFKSKTHLVALEPIARNVAVRRTNSANRWVLSTNTDMIFVPRSGDSLSKIVQNLVPGFYHAPRIEIPEVLWESLDRHASAEIIATVRDWGSTLHLNEIVLGAEFILYDGPGDFQLLLRDDLFANHGFHEEMLLGWHVDSNIAKRMFLKYGSIGDLGPKVYGYHCDHTRQVTPAHSHTRLQNDWRRFCHEVDRPDVPEQADTWGCANDTIEEVRLVSNPASIYVHALVEAIGTPLAEPQITKYSHETYDKSDYDSRHMVPFLADQFVSMPRSCSLAWYGAGVDMLARFATVWEQLGFTGNILVDPALVQQHDVARVILPELASERCDKVDAFVFDFGGLPGPPHDREHNDQLILQLLRRFRSVVRDERARLSARMSPRRVIALNAINNQFESLVGGHIAAAMTPCATHMRHGFVLPVKPKDEWLPLLHIDQAGTRDGAVINSDPRRLGVITHGPYKYLDPGQYRLSVNISLSANDDDHGGTEPCVVIEVHAGAEVFGVFVLSHSELKTPVHEFIFAVPPHAPDLISGVETRFMLLSRVAFSVRAVTVELMPASHGADAATSLIAPSFALKIENWLPYLTIGPLGRAEDADVIAKTGLSDFVVFGPYWPLPGGHYELVLQMERGSEFQGLKPIIRTDVVSGALQLVAANFHLDADGTETTIRLPLQVPGDSTEWRQIETRLWSSGEECFRIRSLSVRAFEQSEWGDLFPFLLLGEAGHRTSAGIGNGKGQRGVVAFCPNLKLLPGFYRMRFRVEIEATGQAGDITRPYAAALVKFGTHLLEIDEIKGFKGGAEERQVVFEVWQHQEPSVGIEFFFQTIRPANILLRTLTIEPLNSAIQRRHPAVLRVRDWLPFLRRGKSVHATDDGVIVSEGVEEFAVYGPYWCLPAGHYEMRASLIPSSQNSCKAAVVAQVTAGPETRLLAESKWRLEQYKLDSGKTFEFRLPFWLADDLPATARSIETRIFTAGDAGFRVVSLRIAPKGDEPEVNWFPYLVVGECGVHSGHEIRSIKDMTGYIAQTPPMRIVPGHYRASLDITIEGDSREENAIVFGIWSGSVPIAIDNVPLGNDRSLTFSVVNSSSDEAIEACICAVTPKAVSLRGLIVERISDALEHEPEPAVLKLKDWLPFLRIGVAGVRGSQHIVAKQGHSGFVVYGPYWPLAQGEYDLLVDIGLDETEASSVRRWSRLYALFMAVLPFAKPPHDGGVDVMLDGRQIAVIDAFTIPSLFSHSISLRLPFKVNATDVRANPRVEARVWSTGQRSFRICSLSIKNG